MECKYKLITDVERKKASIDYKCRAIEQELSFKYIQFVIISDEKWRDERNLRIRIKKTSFIKFEALLTVTKFILNVSKRFGKCSELDLVLRV